MRWTDRIAAHSKLVQMAVYLSLSVAATPLFTEALFGWRWN
jgi:hypothetical protein